MRENHGKKGIIYAENLVKALLCAYLVTGMFLLILALLLYKAGLCEENVNLGIILIYVIGTFSGGFVMGKLEGQKKFLWGLEPVWFILFFFMRPSRQAFHLRYKVQMSETNLLPPMKPHDTFQMR